MKPFERGGNFLLSPATTKLLKNNYFSYLLYSLCCFLFPEVKMDLRKLSNPQKKTQRFGTL